MQLTLRDRLKAVTSVWSSYVLMLATTVFCVGLGQGVINGAATNFFVDVLGLSGKQVLWLAGVREIPGLSLMFIAALIMHWPLSRRAAVSLLLMGTGYVLYSLIHSYTALLATAVVASLGFHVWMPLQSTLGLTLTDKANSGRVLGFLSSMAALASIVGMAFTALVATSVPLRALYIGGGIVIAIGGLLVSRIPANVGVTQTAQPRMILKGRYWLYYVLTFFEGSRMQVFGTFGTLVLVQNYGLSARSISLILVLSGIVNFVLAPRLGHLIDKVGERRDPHRQLHQPRALLHRLCHRA